MSLKNVAPFEKILRNLRTFRRFLDGEERRQVVHAGFVVFMVKTFGLLISLATAMLLARTLGPEGYGSYAYVLSVVALICIPAQFGLPRLVLRETAKAQARCDWAILKGIWYWSALVVLLLSILLVLGSEITVRFLADHFPEQQLLTFAWGLLLIPFLSLGALRAAALIGLRRIVQGQISEMLLRPTLLASFIVIYLMLVPAGGLFPVDVMQFHVLAAAIAFLISTIQLRNARPPEFDASVLPKYQHRIWLAGMFPLVLVDGVQLVFSKADTLMLGWLGSASDVGVYAVALYGSMLIAFGLQVVNVVVAPQFARLHAKGERASLQRLVVFSTRVSVVCALPMVLIIYFWGERLLSFFFGVSFARGAEALTILALGQLVNASMGSVALLLTMTNHERDVVKAIAISTAVNIGLNLILIPILGINGAATATAVATALWNIILWRCVHSRLGIRTLPF
ncbi:MAG: flippase [Azonexus sp.]